MADNYHALLERHFGFKDFLPGQQEVLGELASGKDVLAIMPTGSGKSLCYQLPALTSDGLSLVISPLIALMKDQVDQLARRNYPATFINSTVSLDEQFARLNSVRAGEIKLLYITPERFKSRMFMRAIQDQKVSLFAVDEAHCISYWGHDFRPDYLRLREAVEKLGRPRLLALTATATPRVRRDIVENLGLAEPAVVVAGFDRPNLYLEIAPVQGDSGKMSAIFKIIRQTPGPGIIYAGSRKNVEKVSQDLQENGIASAAYHAGLSIAERTRVQEEFMGGKAPVIVATNAFGMGIDKPDIRYVIHYNFPGSLEAYYQEIGRAGRDGKPSHCLLLYNYADRWLQEFFIDGSHPGADLVKQVYSVLNAQEGIAQLSTRELAQAVGEKNEFAIHSSLVVLEKAGYIERLNSYENRAHVELNDSAFAENSSAIQEDLEGSLQGQVLDALALMVDFSADRSPVLYVRLYDLSRQTGLDQDQLRRALKVLEQKGLLHYEPPFRGRGTRVLRPGEPSLPGVDFKEIARRRDFELKNLQRIIDYASPFRRQCLRGHLLSYFGESSGKRDCRNCSSCAPERAQVEAGKIRAAPVRKRPLQPASRPRGSKENSIPTRRESDLVVALKILSCICRCDNQFGRQKIARILRGSKSRELRHMQSHRTYGLLSHLSEGEILDLIDRLIDKGLTRPSGNMYPTMRMTSDGLAFLRSKPQDFRF
ncbi:MAG: RecQ family ATP-dependent DNA helicase [Acidobacteriota bacterium]